MSERAVRVAVDAVTVECPSRVDVAHLVEGDCVAVTTSYGRTVVGPLVLEPSGALAIEDDVWFWVVTPGGDPHAPVVSITMPRPRVLPEGELDESVLSAIRVVVRAELDRREAQA